MSIDPSTELIKYEQQSLFLPSGEPSVRLLHPRTLEKLAGSSYTPQEILDFITNIRPRDDGRYVLLIALGAGEVFGANRNNDYFPEWSLKGEPPPPDVMDLVRRKGLPVPQEYGYKTFERYGYVYRGHLNNDPIHSIGERVCCAAYNEKMHRVELVAFIYTHKAPDVVEALDAGRPVAFSMGAKLLWDHASCCGNVARSTAEYCECLKTKGGQILPDGRKVFAYNYFPRFFDISEIVVPADRSAYSLKKVAGLGAGDLPTEEGALELSGMAKIAGLLDYLSTGGKTASIEKEIPGEKPAINLGKEPIAPEIWNLLRERAIGDKEIAPDLAPCELDGLRQHPLDKVLSLLTALGVLLRPTEVDGLTGGQGTRLPEKLDFSDISPKLVPGLKDIAERRSLFEPVFSIRVRRITLAKPKEINTKPEGKTPAYTKYLDLLRHGTDAEALKEAMVRPQICSLLNQDCLEKEIIGLGGGVDPEEAMLPFLTALGALDREG